MEFLDINYSLSTWSYIIFGVNLIFYTSTVIASFGLAGKGNLVSMLLSYIILQIVMTTYAIKTSQPGFLLSVIFQTLLLIIMFTVHRKITDEDK